MLTLGCTGGAGPTSDAPTGFPHQTLLEARRTLEIVYANGDSADSVTKRVGLLETLPGGIAVTWASSNPERVALTGEVVLPPAGTAAVSLTATLTSRVPAANVFGQPYLTKTFKLLMASPLDTPTSATLAQATGGAAQSVTGAVRVQIVGGEAMAGSGSQSANGAVVIEHGYQAQ